MIKAMNRTEDRRHEIRRGITWASSLFHRPSFFCVQCVDNHADLTLQSTGSIWINRAWMHADEELS